MPQRLELQQRGSELAILGLTALQPADVKDAMAILRDGQKRRVIAPTRELQ